MLLKNGSYSVRALVIILQILVGVIGLQAQATRFEYSQFIFQKEAPYGFNSSYKPTDMTDHEIKVVEAILYKAIKDFNKQAETNNLRFNTDVIKLDSSKYVYQLVPVLSKKNVKEVWINALCKDYLKDMSKDWRKELIFVEDGGACFFNLRVNLKTNRFSQFSVNGKFK